METKERVKLCPFCEGMIAIEAKVCRFCGSTISHEEAKEPSPYEIDDSLASMYSPPYAPNKTQPEQPPATPQPSSYEYEEPHAQHRYREEEVSYKKQTEETKEEEKEAEVAEESHIGALLLLSIGAQLFTLSWLLFFFSDHGRLTLEWKSRYWVLYLIISLPLLYHGWKRIKAK